MGLIRAVVSGGQTGVDQAALRAAQRSGLDTGGWCPPGRQCDAGTIPARFPMRETPDDRSPDAPDVPRSMRSEWNVRDADATLILRPAAGDVPDAGTDWTARCAGRYGRPLLVCDPADPTAAERIIAWLRATPIWTLNVAGPSERSHPGIGEQVHALLTTVFATPLGG